MVTSRQAQPCSLPGCLAKYLLAAVIIGRCAATPSLSLDLPSEVVLAEDIFQLSVYYTGVDTELHTLRVRVKQFNVYTSQTRTLFSINSQLHTSRDSQLLTMALQHANFPMSAGTPLSVQAFITGPGDTAWNRRIAGKMLDVPVLATWLTTTSTISTTTVSSSTVSSSTVSSTFTTVSSTSTTGTTVSSSTVSSSTVSSSTVSSTFTTVSSTSTTGTTVSSTSTSGTTVSSTSTTRTADSACTDCAFNTVGVCQHLGTGICMSIEEGADECPLATHRCRYPTTATSSSTVSSTTSVTATTTTATGTSVTSTLPLGMCPGCALGTSGPCILLSHSLCFGFIDNTRTCDIQTYNCDALGNPPTQTTATTTTTATVSADRIVIESAPDTVVYDQQAVEVVVSYEVTGGAWGSIVVVMLQAVDSSGRAAGENSIARSFATPSARGEITHMFDVAALQLGIGESFQIFAFVTDLTTPTWEHRRAVTSTGVLILPSTTTTTSVTSSTQTSVTTVSSTTLSSTSVSSTSTETTSTATTTSSTVSSVTSMTSSTVSSTTGTSTTATTATSTTETVIYETLDFEAYPEYIGDTEIFQVMTHYTTNLEPGAAKLQVIFTGSNEPNPNSWRRINKQSIPLPQRVGSMAINIPMAGIGYDHYSLLVYIVPVADIRWDNRVSSNKILDILPRSTSTTTISTTTSVSATTTTSTASRIPEQIAVLWRPQYIADNIGFTVIIRFSTNLDPDDASLELVFTGNAAETPNRLAQISKQSIDLHARVGTLVLAIPMDGISYDEYKLLLYIVPVSAKHWEMRLSNASILDIGPIVTTMTTVTSSSTTMTATSTSTSTTKSDTSTTHTDTTMTATSTITSTTKSDTSTTHTDTSTTTPTTATTTTQSSVTSTSTFTTRTLMNEDVDFVYWPRTIERSGQFPVSVRYSTNLAPGEATLQYIFLGNAADTPTRLFRIAKSGIPLFSRTGSETITIPMQGRSYEVYQLLVYIVPRNDTRWDARLSNRTLYGITPFTTTMTTQTATSTTTTITSTTTVTTVSGTTATEITATDTTATATDTTATDTTMTDTSTTTTGTSATVTDTTATLTTATLTTATLTTATATTTTATDTTATLTTATTTTTTATETTRTLLPDDVDFVSYPATIEAVGQFHVSIRYSTQILRGIARLVVVFTGTQSEDPNSPDYERISKHQQSLPEQQGYTVVTIQTTQQYAYYRLLAYVVPASDTRWEARYSNRSLGPTEIQAVTTTTSTVTATTKTSTSATDTSVTTTAAPTMPAPNYSDRQCAGSVLRMVLTVETMGTDIYSQDAVSEAAAMSIYWRLKIRLPNQAVPCVTPVRYDQGYQIGVRFLPGNDAELCAALLDNFESTDAANKYTITSPPDLTLTMTSVEFVHCGHPTPENEGSRVVTIKSTETQLSGADGEDGEDYSGLSTTAILVILFGVLLCFAMVALHQMWRRTVDVEEKIERRKMRKQLRLKQEHGMWSAPDGTYPMVMTSPAMPNMVGPVQSNPLSPANSAMNGYIGINGHMSPLHGPMHSPPAGHGGYMPISSPLVPMSNGGFMPAGPAYNVGHVPVTSPMVRPSALRTEEDGAWDDAMNSYSGQHRVKSPNNGEAVYDFSGFHGPEITESIDGSKKSGPVYDVGGFSGQQARANSKPEYARPTDAHPKPEYAKVTKYHDPDDEPVYETAMTFIKPETDKDGQGDAIYQTASYNQDDSIYARATHTHADAIYDKATYNQDDSIYAKATQNSGGDIYERATRLASGHGSNLDSLGDAIGHTNKASKFKRANSVFLADHNDDDDNETVCDDTGEQEEEEAPGVIDGVAYNHRDPTNLPMMATPENAHNKNGGGRRPVSEAQYAGRNMSEAQYDFAFGTKPKPRSKR